MLGPPLCCPVPQWVPGRCWYQVLSHLSLQNCEPNNLSIIHYLVLVTAIENRVTGNRADTNLNSGVNFRAQVPVLILTIWLEASGLTRLCPSFLTWKVKVIIEPITRVF